MGLDYPSVYLLAQLSQKLTNHSDARVLTMGVQDCAYTLAELIRFLDRFQLTKERDVKPLPTTSWRAQRGDEPFTRYIHQKTAFQVIGFDPDKVQAVDVSTYEKPDFCADFNNPLDASLEGQYDYLFDGGTLEHIFDAPQALENIVRLLKPGGMAIHVTPMDWIRHGFYNFNPGFFDDFYSANGFVKIESRVAITPATVVDEPIDHFYIGDTERFYYPISPAYQSRLYLVVRKQENVTSIKKPQQAYYESLWPEEQRKTKESGDTRLTDLINSTRRVSPALFGAIKGYLYLRKAQRVNI